MMTKQEVEKKKAAARKRVAELDKTFSKFEGGGKDRSLGTIIAALEAGLVCGPKDVNGAEWDALVMLEELRSKELPMGTRLPRSFRN